MYVHDVFMRAMQLHQAGQLQQAEQIYRQILQVDPRHAETLHCLGMLAHQVGKTNLALDYIGQAIALNPAQPVFHCNMGVVYEALKRSDDALASYAQALRLKPDFAEAHYNQGLTLLALGRLGEAAASYRQALRFNPRYAEAASNLAAALSQDGKLDEAVAACRQALAINPNFALAYINLAGILTQQGKLEEAEAASRQALRLRPDQIEGYNNLASALVPQGKLEEAEMASRQALKLNPKSVEAWNHLAIGLAEQGKLDEGLAACEEVLKLNPDHAEAHVNRAVIWFLSGDLQQAWPEYEWRWQMKSVLSTSYRQPLWDGSDLTGRTILLRTEQGLGDTLHFIRYAPMVKERGGTVLFEVPKALEKILVGFPGIDRLVPKDEPLPDFDVQAPLLTLPGIFGTTLQTIPAKIPYLFPDDRLVEQWRQRLSTVAGFRIGISWQGEARNRKDPQRSVPLTQFAPLARLPGVRLISLQKGLGAEQIKPASGKVDVIDLGDQLDTASGPFMDTAAIMKNLDLVICVDTVIGHLAGALGVPVWLAISAVPHWPWMLQREDSPWYPTMRLFRQTRLAEWRDVFERMVTELQKKVAAKAGPRILIEVAPGELIDKITILQIKSERLTDAAPLANVHRELTALQKVKDRDLPVTSELAELTAELRRVNEALWQVEDDIRVCDCTGDLGPRFIELARSVYRLNDQRGQLKRRINDLLGSRIVEEKMYERYES